MQSLTLKWWARPIYWGVCCYHKVSNAAAVVHKWADLRVIRLMIWLVHKGTKPKS